MAFAFEAFARPEPTKKKKIIQILKKINSLNSDQIVWNDCLS